MAGLSGGRTRGIGALAIFTFVLLAFPKAGTRIGGAPLYVLDLMALCVIFYAAAAPKSGRRRPMAGIIVTIYLFAVAGEVMSIVYAGTVFDSAYLIGRTSLAFLVFYAAGTLVRNPSDVAMVLKGAALGVIVTASSMVLTSLPATRGFATGIIFSSSFIDPVANSIKAAAAEAGESGIRGWTPVGVSIMGATFINAGWPLAALLIFWPIRSAMWRKIALAACLIAPMGVLMSYSRGPILGTILILVTVLVMGLGAVRRGIVLPIAVGAAIVMTVGVGSQVFFFDRLVNRTSAIFDDPLADERESERLLAYVEPFQHLMEHPIFLFVGEGNAIGKSGASTQQGDKATHALFAKAYYTNGMIAAVLYMILLASALRYALANVRSRPRGSPGYFYSHAMLLCVVALLPWAAFGHAIVSEARGAMLFFFVLGLLTSLENFPRRSARPVQGGGAVAYGRPAAV